MDIAEQDSITEINELMLKNEFAKQLLETQLNILIKEFEYNNHYNPVEHIKSRIKSEKSIREKLNIPRGERYELCRSVHAEMNAIISASRNEMLGADLYLVCIDYLSGDVVAGTSSCSMCKRAVINAGIARVIIRDTMDEYRIIDVSDWIENDESLIGQRGY